MSTPYNCELCKKEFKQKIDFTRHTSKKVPCISLSEIQQLEQNKGVTNDIKSQIVNTFKQILNILRTEGLTGEKALRNMCYFLVLKLIEPQLETPINIYNYPYDFTTTVVSPLECKQKMLHIVRFTNLANEPQEKLATNLKILWEVVLSFHPSTKNIFLVGKQFDIKHNSTYKKIIDHLNKITFTDTGFDVLGEAYEEVIKDIMVGKVLGQFFTPVSVKELMVKLINPQIHPDGKIDTIGDPTMGTGGFLISYLKHIKEQANIKQIQPDWDFIKTFGLYGKEIEPDTYQLAISNMLISTGHMFENMDNGDSIREPITRKFDNILANPPFGIKGLKYDEIDFTKTTVSKTDYLPIKSDNAVSLFIQAIIYMLNVNGKCAIVLPDGQELTSKTNKTFVAIREYLMKTCNLKKVVYLPSGTFTHTAIKTCIFYFIKKREGKYVLDTNIKVSEKTKKETGRTYTFHKTHQTTKIKFYEFNESKNETYLLVEVPIEKIANNSYSLNYSEYMKHETEENVEEGIVVKTLGEVCNFNIGGTPSRSIKEYYENGTNLWVSVRELNGGYIYDTKEKITDLGIKNSSVKLFEKGTILFSFKLSIGKTAIVGNPLYTNEAIAGILSKNNKILNNKYLYYYLSVNDFSKLGSGVFSKGSLNKGSLSRIKIPIPSLDKQQEIVNYLDFVYEKCIKTSLSKIAELKQLNEFCLKNQQLYGDNVVKILGEVCKVNPENIKSGQYTEINYIDIASVKGGQILELQKLTNDFPSRAKRIVKKGDILYSSVRPNLKGYVYISDDIQNGIASTGFADIRVTEQNTILSKYLYYIMTSDYISDDLISKAKGAQYPAVSFDDFETIKIHIPSLERQQEIVEYCEYNDTLIKQLEKEIENNKKQAHQFMSSIVKSSKVSEDNDDASLVNTDSIDDAQETLSIEEEEEEIVIE